jgi:hypothetical protein
MPGTSKHVLTAAAIAIAFAVSGCGPDRARPA